MGAMSFWAAQPDRTLFNCHYQQEFRCEMLNTGHTNQWIAANRE